MKTLSSFQFFLMAFVFLSFTSCNDADDDKGNGNGIIGIGANDVSEASGIMGLDLLKTIHAKEPGETVLISPLSIQTAFNMALEAAKENTYDQISATMRYGSFDLETIRKQSGETANVLVNQSGHPSVTIANAFFYDPSRLDPKTAFLEALSDYYAAHVATDDFAQQVAVDNINQWVSDKTKKLIEEIIEEIGQDELAFLINALHFKSDWAHGFDKNQTSSGSFTKSDGSKVTVDFMSQDRTITSAMNDQWEMVDLPFKDSTFSLTLVRPADEQKTNWLKDFTHQELKALYDKLEAQRIYLKLPKMELEFEYELSEPLKDLGMTDAFSPQVADFSDMGTPLQGPRIFITRVDHKTVLKVDEKGAEGAAVTSIGFGVLSMPPSITFNVPYLLSLRHIPSGTVLFMGFVEEPG
ncbi:MAG: hypothetical protein LAT54_08125 [Cryomorphaceae bacterium]|nr:hypothetical protein [Cryomorphaceae bacterium]